MIRSYQPEELAAKIKATNAVNAVANNLYPKLTAIFAPLVGTKIVKADGDLTTKVKKLLADVEGLGTAGKVQIWLDGRNKYSLSWYVKTHENYGQYTCTYADTSLYIGSMAGDTLTSLTPFQPRRTDLTVDEVNGLVQDHKEKEKIASDAASKLYQTGLF